MRRPVCLFVMLFTAAVWVTVLLWPPQPSIGPKAEGRYVTLRGTVEEKEYAVRDPGGEQYIRMTLGNVSLESEIPQEGAFEIKRGDKVLCTIEEEPELQKEWAHEGAAVRIRGRIRLFRRPSNDGEFDSFMYYSVIGGYLFTLSDSRILAYDSGKDPLKSAIFELRTKLTDLTDEIFGNRHGGYGRRCASVMKAMLLGQSGLIDRQIKEKYQAAGIVHVICVSGVVLSAFGYVYRLKNRAFKGFFGATFLKNTCILSTILLIFSINILSRKGLFFLKLYFGAKVESSKTYGQKVC